MYNMLRYLKYVLHTSAALIVFAVLVIGTGMVLKARLDKIIDLGSRQLPHLNLSDAGIPKNSTVERGSCGERVCPCNNS